LAGFIGDGDDNNGKFARFDFVQQPLSATKLVEDAPSINLTPMLTAIYERLDALPQQNFELDRAARKLFIRFYNYCETQRISHPKQGMRAMWGKAPLKVGKIATILHCLHAAHLGWEIFPKITIETIRSAIKFINFTTDQALSLNLEICESNELAPNLAKIVFLASRKGTVTVSEIRQGFNSKHRPSAHQVRDWFKQLSTMKYGEVVEVGKTISFMCPTWTTSASNPYPERVQGVQLPVRLGVQLEAEVSNLPVSAALKEDRPPNVQESNLETKLDIETEVGHEVGHGVGHAKPLYDKAFGSKLDRLDTLDTALNEELVNFVRVAIAENDRELAQNILSILKEVCGAGAVDRKQVWNALTPEEQTALTALLKPYTETEEIVITSEPEIQPEIASEVEPEKPLITALDAENIRDIALFWWDVYYPEQLQSLIVQMFGWNSPGAKYTRAIINQWLETEEELVSDRINQLFNFAEKSS
jgi:hypothetical protein